MVSFSLYDYAYLFGKYPNSNKILVGIVTFLSKVGAIFFLLFVSFLFSNIFLKSH